MTTPSAEKSVIIFQPIVFKILNGLILLYEMLGWGARRYGYEYFLLKKRVMMFVIELFGRPERQRAPTSGAQVMGRLGSFRGVLKG
ncbi:hypothetical protein [Halomonas alkalisoli]|uniref:hypothetical protein n=1 Tax=Halomonas alkalisoli TaxID=2907158 RepID=UPI001F3113D9|nr:hypothetical protein [Halomonas alkalisoli]MCE9683899.1 hypothetical protein [Halomonas alkalisoli]